MTVRLELALARRVRREGLWSPGDGVAIAVSGGMDSVVLLDLMVASAGVHGASMSVVTVDHGTRAGSAGDADFVAELAAAYGVPCHRVDLDLGEASEARCRDARYAAFETVEADHIALAHHGRDQVETALLGWMRGAGTAGMAGMPVRRGRYVRPLLEESPEALLAWAERRGLRWREDPSNDSPRYARNRVRHEVLPVLSDIRGGVVRTMARGVRHAREDASLLDAMSVQAEIFDEEEGSWAIEWLRDAPRPLTRRAILRRLGEVGSATIDDLLAAVGRGKGTVILSPSVHVVVTRDRVLIRHTDDQERPM